MNFIGRSMTPLRALLCLTLLTLGLGAAPVEPSAAKGQKPNYTFLMPSKLKKTKITFTWLVLIYTQTEIPANEERGHGLLSEGYEAGTLENIRRQMQNFETDVAKFTRGEVGYNLAVVVLPKERPLRSLHWLPDVKKYGWTRGQDIKEELDQYAGNKTGWFDNVQVFFPLSGQFKPPAAYGGGEYVRDNMTRSQLSIGVGQKYTGERHVGIWHESIHGLEAQYWFDKRSPRAIKQPVDFDQKPIIMHNQESFGYTGAGGTPETLECYYRWMGDLITGNIRDLRKTGPKGYMNAKNTGLGFGQEMFKKGPARYEYKFKPGGPFPQ
jgi:hypothetical protein